METTKDRGGHEVRVGTFVRVLRVRPSVLARLTSDEAARVQSMQGHSFEVYEVDLWGSAWVTKRWNSGEDKSESHSLGLPPEDMEVVVHASDAAA